MTRYKPKPCRFCGQNFDPPNTSAKWCSLKCRIKTDVEVDPETGCWLWTGARRQHGYGQVFWSSRVQKAHRAAYEAWKGPIPEGMCVCHSCDTPRCVNPGHLWLGTPADNMADKMAKGRQARGQMTKGRQARGEITGSAKLLPAAVLEIYRDQRLQREVAQDYGISRSNVSCIKLGKSWAHVTGHEWVGFHE